MADLHDFQPLANHILLAVPERYTQHYAQGTKRLYLPAGSDDWAATTEALKLGFGTATEADESAHQTLVQTGTVLAIPRQLTADMTLCSGYGTREVPRLEGVFDSEHRHIKGRNGRDLFRENGTMTVNRPKTCADITDPVAVGDTLYVEGDYLDDEHEISPGVYLLPYSSLICKVGKLTLVDVTSHADAFRNYDTQQNLRPIGGYVIMTRVWAEDVVDAEVEGRTTKARFSKTVPALLDEADVKPLDNEGVVAWLGDSLRGSELVDPICVGQHLVFHPGHALVETICGVEYICSRQEYCMAVREPKNALDSKIQWATPNESAYDSTAKPLYNLDELSQMQKLPNPDYTEEDYARWLIEASERAHSDFINNAGRQRTYGGGWIGYPNIPIHAPCYDA